MINSIALALLLLRLALDEALKNHAPEDVIIIDLQSAIDALVKVHGTDVTFQQLEALRVKPEW